jgi:hypothetical protein
MFVLLASNPQKVYARKLYWKNGKDAYGRQRYVLSKRRNTYGMEGRNIMYHLKIIGRKLLSEEPQ